MSEKKVALITGVTGYGRHRPGWCLSGGIPVEEGLRGARYQAPRIEFQYSVRDFVNAAAKELGMGIRWKGTGVDEEGYWISPSPDGIGIYTS